MRRNILSIVLAALMIVSAFLLVGCKVDDVEAKMIENDAKLEGAISDAVNEAEGDIKSAADTAAANLEDATKKLEAIIVSGNALNEATLNSAIKEFNDALDEAELALQITVDAVANDAAADNEALAEDLENAIDDATRILDASLQQKIRQTKTALEDAMVAKDTELEGEIADVVNELSAVSKLVLETAEAFDDDVRADITKAYTELVAATRKALEEKIDTAVEELTKKINKNIEDIAENNRLIKINENEISLLKDRVTTNEQNIAANVKSIADNLAKINENKLAIEANTKKITDEVKRLDEAINGINTKITKLEGDIAQTLIDSKNYADQKDTALKNDLEQQIATVQSNLNTVKTTLETADTALQGQINTLSTNLATTKNDLQGQIDDLVTDLGTATTNIANNASAIATNAGNITANTNNITALTNAKNSLETRATDLETAVSALEAIGIEAELTAIKADIAAANSSINDINTVLAAWNNATDAVVAAIGSLDTKVTTAVAENPTYEAKIRAYAEELKIRLLRATSVDAVNAIIGTNSDFGIDAKVTEWKAADLATAQTEAKAQVASDITAAKTANPGYETALDALQATVEAEIDAATTPAAVTAIVNGLADRITTAVTPVAP